MASRNRAVGGQLAVQRNVAGQKEIGTAATKLGGVQGWAQDKQRSQKVLDTSAVVGLDLAQKKNIVEAIHLLSAAQSALGKAANPFAPGLAALRLALGKAKAAAADLQTARDEGDRYNAKKVLLEGQAAMAKAIKALQGVAGVSPQIKKNLQVLHANMAGTEGIHDTINSISAVIQAVEALRTGQGVKPEAVGRVLFLLRSFVAVNDPSSPEVPKPAEVAAMKGELGSMQDDFAAVFGSSNPFALFIDYVDRLVRQIDVRDAMAQAGAPIKQVPAQADAQAYFTKLKNEPNDEVFQAYTAFMSAFFFHKLVSTIADLTATNANLMAVPASITGTRPLVCTGYATLGAELLRLAGATQGEIIIGFRASDAQLLSGAIDAGHAVTKFTRKGQTRWVSNDLIVDSEANAIGPDAVAWPNKNHRLIKAKGPTMAAAVSAIMEAMARARAAAAKRRATTKIKTPVKA